MPCVRLSATFAACVVLLATLEAQSRPDFSGTWVVALPEKSWPPEQRVTIGHDASTLTIDATAYLIQGRTNGVQSSMSSTAYPVRTTYVLDGLEHPSSVVMRSVVPDYPGREFPMPVPGMASSYDQGSFRATWIGSQLVVMKYEKHTVTGPNRTPVAIRRTTREAFALSPDGNLVWETLTLSDPIPGSSEAPTPTPFRRVFRRS